MDFKEVSELFKDDLGRVEKSLRDNYFSDIPLVPGIGDYIMNGGGKRVRPLLLLICNRLCGGQADAKIIRHATAIEYVHAASLLHDDVVDETTVRRGNPTVNTKWGSDASILVGDFLIARALLLLSNDVDAEVFRSFAEGAKTLVEGGLLEFTHARDVRVSESHCLDVAFRKTASVMALACQLGAQLAGANAKTVQSLFDFGRNFGIAFQLVDDAMDYEGSKEQLGKAPGTDFKEGHVTLPLLHLYQNADNGLKRQIEGFIQNDRLTQKDLDFILDRMREVKAVEYTLGVARDHMSRAKSLLQGIEFSHPEFKPALQATANHIVDRFQPAGISLISSRT